MMDFTVYKKKERKKKTYTSTKGGITEEGEEEEEERESFAGSVSLILDDLRDSCSAGKRY